jgi:hypothetical protein
MHPQNIPVTLSRGVFAESWGILFLIAFIASRHQDYLYNYEKNLENMKE